MIRIYAEIFCWKNVSSFCSAKATHIFSAKNFRKLYIESAKIVNEMTLNELIKLTTLFIFIIIPHTHTHSPIQTSAPSPNTHINRKQFSHLNYPKYEIVHKINAKFISLQFHLSINTVQTFHQKWLWKSLYLRKTAAPMAPVEFLDHLPIK